MTAQAADLHARHARSDLVEEPGRRRDRRRPDQARRLRSREEVPAALRDSRRPDRHRSADAAAADTRYYPADIWAARGALVLKVNYRGSAGYGEKFRS